MAGINDGLGDEDESLFLMHDDKLRDKYNKIMESDISILRTFISVVGKEFLIKPRVYNEYYSNCPIHLSRDFPLRINESRKAFCCYGCGVGGTVVTLISRYYHISFRRSIEIVYSFISNNVDSLTKEELSVLKEAFKDYNSPIVEKYYEESKIKTKKLEERIKNYIKKLENEEVIDDTKIAKRLCCTKDYVRRFIPREKLPDIKQTERFSFTYFVPDEELNAPEGRDGELPFEI